MLWMPFQELCTLHWCASPSTSAFDLMLTCKHSFHKRPVFPLMFQSVLPSLLLLDLGPPLGPLQKADTESSVHAVSVVRCSPTHSAYGYYTWAEIIKKRNVKIPLTAILQRCLSISLGLTVAMGNFYWGDKMFKGIVGWRRLRTLCEKTLL